MLGAQLRKPLKGAKMKRLAYLLAGIAGFAVSMMGISDTENKPIVEFATNSGFVATAYLLVHYTIAAMEKDGSGRIILVAVFCILTIFSFAGLGEEAIPVDVAGALITNAAVFAAMTWVSFHDTPVGDRRKVATTR